MASVLDLLLFHKIDRRLFETILSLGRNPGLAQNVVGLWIWLEFIGVDMINHLKHCTTPAALLRFVQEAEVLLHVIRQDNPPSAHNQSMVPLMASLFSEPVDLRFFYCHREVVVRGIANVIDGVGKFIFDDHLYRLLHSYEAAHDLAQEQGENLPVVPEELARPYNSQVIAVPEDHRSMFITFSKGFPLTREEIAEYFTEKWGQCVERVMVERTAPGVMPMYGRIVFTSGSLVDIVLNGAQMVKFMIKGRHVWGRKYVPRSNHLPGPS